MKINFKVFVAGAMSLVLLCGCSSMSNTSKGALFGAGGGAALGAGIGALAGGGKGAAIGAAIGAGVGAGTGALVGKRMDKQQAELEAQLKDAKVETVTDKNNLQAIKVTFDSGILFQTGKSDLSSTSMANLASFAASVNANSGTDVTIYGHTDNTGSRQVNEQLSRDRAKAVANYIIGKGVNSTRITTEGLAYDQPVADNSTAAGRAQNRRVEIFISANQEMINQAEAGTLK